MPSPNSKNMSDLMAGPSFEICRGATTRQSFAMTAHGSFGRAISARDGSNVATRKVVFPFPCIENEQPFEAAKDQQPQSF